MDPFFKYMNPGQEDKDWGLYLNCTGKAVIKPGVVYPPDDHPSGYYFTYEIGRILNEYQINYITDGEGTYENNSGKYMIQPGSLLITKPGEWHRYRPKKRTGWVEHYVGFTGYIAHQMFGRPWFTSKNAVVQIGNRQEIIDTYYKIFNYILEEKPGYQQVAARYLLNLAILLEKKENFAVIVFFNPLGFTLQVNLDSVLLQDLQNLRSNVLVFPS